MAVAEFVVGEVTVLVAMVVVRTVAGCGRNGSGRNDGVTVIGGKGSGTGGWEWWWWQGRWQ